MKYSQTIGCILVLLLAGICYLPWSFIPGRNILVTGLSAPGTMYGKPGLMHFALGVILIAFFSIPKIWAKRINVFIGTINLAWSIRNFMLLSTCFMGECPEKKMGLYLELLLCIGILIMTFLPDLKQLEKNKS
ncbi:hypothetical protein [Parafilimonas sp.]|uniref:hypothetical protein n=1 Tax=Parafilimonas sp. TaxID=1969739 RepID=UPI0039E43406